MTDAKRIERRRALEHPIGQLRRMIEIRAVEDAIQQLFNDGHVRGSTHLSSGQEAVSVGVASVARRTDTVSCTYRGHGHALALGLSPVDVMAEICGRSTGCAGGMGGSMHLFGADVGLLPTFAIVGAGLPVATGFGLAAWVRGSDDAAVAFFGDGTANIGAFHESLNLASILKLPVVFVCENNLYGEYTRINLTTPITDIADRAASYAMPSAVVDGQDIDQVRAATSEALDRARAGEGPTLLEMKTYRYSGHSRTDPATYRPEGELDEWLARDPIEILGRRLEREGLVQLDAIRAELAAEVQLGVVEALAGPHPDQSQLLAHVLAPEELG